MARPRKADQLTDTFDITCDDRVVHIETVTKARNALPRPEIIGGMTELFAALGDPTRLRMVASLTTHELCVCDLAAAVGQSESAVSHHLRSMRALGLVHSRRAGRLVYYSLDDEHVGILYAQALEHIEHRNTEHSQ